MARAAAAQLADSYYKGEGYPWAYLEVSFQASVPMFGLGVRREMMGKLAGRTGCEWLER
jgi:hypothetical protein